MVIIELFIHLKIELAGAEELYIIGEGMGGLLGFYFASECFVPLVKGVVFMPGLFTMKRFCNPFVKAAIELLNLAAPERYVADKYLNGSSTERAVCREDGEDSLSVRDRTVRLVLEIDRAVGYLRENIKKLSFSCLIFTSRSELSQGMSECLRLLADVDFDEGRHLVGILEEVTGKLGPDAGYSELKKMLVIWLESFYFRPDRA